MKKIYFSFLLLFTITTVFSQLEGTTWKLAPTAEALAVGPTQGDFSWWANSADDVSTRACLFDDTFVFGADGAFSNVQGGETWLETWQGAASEGCGAPITPHDGATAYTWSYDESAGTVTLTGVGAHLGLPKVNNAGELTSPADAPASITYPVVIDGNTMTVDINFGGGFWHYAFEKVETVTEPAPTGLAGTTWKIAPIAQAISVGPAADDLSWWGNSIEDVTGRACFFDDKYVFAEDGTFTNVLDGSTWLEGWQGVEADGCGTPIAPHDGTPATWSYDEAAGTVTLTGAGAYLGIPKANNAGELTSPANAPASITYPVVIDGNTMTILLDFGGGFWQYILEKDGATEPAPAQTGLAGSKWKLAPMAGALAVGPTQDDLSWWAIGEADVVTRACFFDDQYVFNEDGSFNNVLDGSTWIEPWQGVEAEECGTPVAPHDGSNAATWAYDEAAGTITLDGVGAYLGLPKVNNAGELKSSADAPASIIYPVVMNEKEDTMTIDIDFGGGFWQYIFVRVTGNEPAPNPVKANVEFSVDMSGYTESFTTVYVNGPFNSWVGDANPLSDENGDGIWAGTVSLAAGTYEFKYTIDNWAAQELFVGGEDCTITTDGFTNRVVTVSEDTEICFKWNTCDACPAPEPEPTPDPVSIEGTWKLAPIAQALAVGPTQGDLSWWGNSADDVTTRACLFDDQFVFGADGTFSNVQDESTWLEAWQGAEADGCGTPVTPHDGSNAATWSYDEAAGTITLNGVGAHLGLPKVNNAGELTSPADAPASITYPIVIVGNRMTVDIDFGGGFWHFVFEKEAEVEPVPEPADIAGTWKLAPIAQALAVGPTQGDLSWWANSVDDVTTRACLFDDQFVFGEDGSFSNVQNESTWLEVWQGAEADGCGTPVTPHDGSNTATWAYDEMAGTITLTGVGAHLGLPKVNNAGELKSPADAPASITYPVEIVGNTMTVDIDFGGGFWHFVFEKQAEVEPEPEPADITGSWKLAPIAQALAVGPTQGDLSWWGNSADDVATRACLFDDQFVFGADGTFSNVQDGNTWLEAWQGVEADGCGTPVAPHDGSNTATWAYDEMAGTITLTGVGAHLGLPKVNNAGELKSPADAPASITYPITIVGNTMTADIDFGGGFWRFVFEKEATSSTSIEIVAEALFNFFPNPANNQIQIQSDKVIDELTIHDITGRILISRVKPSSNETVDVSGLTTGLYIIQARVGDKVSVEKLSIN